MRKTAIITGGTSGVGLSLVKKYLSTNEWDVISISRTEDKIKLAEKELGGLTNNCTFIKGDISKSKDLDVIFKEINETYGKIDLLVNSAGTIYAGGIEELSLEDWEKTLSINLTAPYMVSKKLLPLIKKGQDASVINISSISSQLTGSSIAYSTCKAGLDMLTKSLAKELAKYKIRVNSVNPGVLNTGFQVTNGLLEGEGYTRFLENVGKTYPLGVGSAEDITNMVYYLSSKEAKWITGSIVTVDGGRSINI